MHGRERQGARSWAAALAVGLLVVGGSAHAQPGGLPVGRPPPSYAPPSRFASPPDELDRPAEAYEVELSTDEPGDLGRRFGLHNAKSLLGESDLATKLRGIERLGALGTAEALGELALLLEDDSPGYEPARVRLGAVRALAAHASVEEARDALVGVAGAGSLEATPSPLDALGRETATMALARSGDERAITALVAAVIQGGESGTWAERALRAYPPDSIEKLVGKSALTGKTKPMDRRVVRLLGELGDLRAVPILRRQLSLERPIHQLPAARALAALGDGSVATLLRRWLHAAPPKAKGPVAGKKGAGKPSTDAPSAAAPTLDAAWSEALAAEAKLVAVEGLLVLDEPDGRAGLAALLAAGQTRRPGLELALRWPSPELVAPLGAMLRGSLSRSEREQAVELLGRIGDDGASTILVRMLARPELSTLAAFGLASSPSPTARRGMQQALAAASAGPARRLMLRAALVRYAKLGDTIEGLGDALLIARESPDAADRWTAGQGLALLGMVPLAELLRSNDDATALGAASASAALGVPGMASCAARLASIGARLAGAGPRADWALGPPDAAAPLMATACGTGLLGPASPVSPSVLARWAEAGGALAPAAARALAALDPKPLRDRVVRLLEGTDPAVRAHVALGLGRSREPDATSLLTGAYHVEAEPAVRRAVVRALSQRRDPLRRGPLALAAELDPDEQVRALARSALRGQKHEVEASPAGPGVLWVSLLGPSKALSASAAMRPARVERADGLALPVLSAPDGNLLGFGLHRAGTVAVRIAPAPALGDADP